MLDAPSITMTFETQKGGIMKGRRKVKTLKWKMKADFEEHAQGLLRNRSDKQNRFLDRALLGGCELEPG